jgi:hypothetical protein
MLGCAIKIESLGRFDAYQPGQVGAFELARELLSPPKKRALPVPASPARAQEGLRLPAALCLRGAVPALEEGAFTLP